MSEPSLPPAELRHVAESAIRVAAPIIATYALGWAVQFAARKAWHTISGGDRVGTDGELQRV